MESGGCQSDHQVLKQRILTLALAAVSAAVVVMLSTWGR